MTSHRKVPVLHLDLGVHTVCQVRIGRVIGAQVVIVEHTVVVLIDKQTLDGASFLIIDLLEHIEHIGRITNVVHHILESAIITRRTETTEVGRGSVIGQFKYLVGVIGEVTADFPGEVLGLHRDGVDGELDTRVAQATDVVNHILCEVRTCRHLGLGINQVGGLAVVPVDATVDAVVGEAIVETDVPGCGGLPLQVRVVGIGLQELLPCTVAPVLALTVGTQ